MSEPRKFTTDFRLGDYVSVIRTDHGWYDGSLVARVTQIEDYLCTVLDAEGHLYEILKPRDIRKNEHPDVEIPMPGEVSTPSKHKKKRKLP